MLWHDRMPSSFSLQGVEDGETSFRESGSSDYSRAEGSQKGGAESADDMRDHSGSARHSTICCDSAICYAVTICTDTCLLRAVSVGLHLSLDRQGTTLRKDPPPALQYLCSPVRGFALGGYVLAWQSSAEPVPWLHHALCP